MAILTSALSPLPWLTPRPFLPPVLYLQAACLGSTAASAPASCAQHPQTRSCSSQWTRCVGKRAVGCGPCGLQHWVHQHRSYVAQTCAERAHGRYRVGAADADTNAAVAAAPMYAGHAPAERVSSSMRVVWRPGRRCSCRRSAARLPQAARSGGHERSGPAASRHATLPSHLPFLPGTPSHSIVDLLKPSPIFTLHCMLVHPACTFVCPLSCPHPENPLPFVLRPLSGRPQGMMERILFATQTHARPF